MKVHAVKLVQTVEPKERRILTKTYRIDAEIDKVTRDLQKSYDTNSEKIRKLKEKTNSLEKALGQENGKSAKRITELNHAMQLLNELSDSLIMTSKKAIQRLNSLERKSETSGLESNRLNDLRSLCKKTELMAADFLCYTLGFFQHQTLEASSASASTT
jgi:predicted  nucleic acid-binding Zn-ribbon protein